MTRGVARAVPPVRSPTGPTLATTWMIDAIAVIGVIGSLLATLAGTGVRRVWVFGYQLADMTKDRDFWRDAALRSMTTTDKAIDTVRKSSSG